MNKINKTLKDYISIDDILQLVLQNGDMRLDEYITYLNLSDEDKVIKLTKYIKNNNKL